MEQACVWFRAGEVRREGVEEARSGVAERLLDQVYASEVQMD